MSRRHSSFVADDHRRRHSAAHRGGMTLIELVVAASVMSLVAVALGGLVIAVDSARSHVRGVHEATAQGQFAIDRIRSAVNRSGSYRIGTGATVLGVAVVWTDDRPETLVVWTGGRDASLADASPLDRLPKANELVLYTPDPDEPLRLVEIVVPTATGNVDFDSAGFEAQIRQLVGDAGTEKLTLCDRVRLSSVDSTSAANVRFELDETPTAAQIAATPVGTEAWRSLPWVSGVSSSRAGLRQCAVRIELQTVTLDDVTNDSASPSLPGFGVAVRRYEHREG